MSRPDQISSSDSFASTSEKFEDRLYCFINFIQNVSFSFKTLLPLKGGRVDWVSKKDCGHKTRERSFRAAAIVGFQISRVSPAKSAILTFMYSVFDTDYLKKIFYIQHL